MKISALFIKYIPMELATKICTIEKKIKNKLTLPADSESDSTLDCAILKFLIFAKSPMHRRKKKQLSKKLFPNQKSV